MCDVPGVDMTLLDPRNGADHDLPAPATPPRAYVIASVPRSGSTLLARLLWGTGRVGAPKEYLNPMQLRDWEVRFGGPVSRRAHGLLDGRVMGAVVGRGWSEARLAAHLERVRMRRSSGGWFGLKLHHHHFLRMGGRPALDRLLPEVRWVRIQRPDRLGQALSWHRALSSGRWASWQTEARPPTYRRDAIRRRLQAIDVAEAGWDRALADVPVHSLTYAELVADPEAAVRGVLRWLDVEDADAVAVVPPPTRRQADARTQDWRARWLSGA